MNVFPENLKKFAEEKEVTLREVAEKIGVSDVRMCKIMEDQIPLRPMEIINLLLYFDCKPTELFGNMFEGFFDD